MTETEKAWLAGIIDGEGCISAYIREHCPSVRLVLTIVNTNREIIEEYKRLVNFKNYTVRYFAHLGHKDRLIVQLTGPKTIEVLKQVRPYLIGKKKQCDAALKFVLIKKTDRLNERQRITNLMTYASLRLLNRRGQPKIA